MVKAFYEWIRNLTVYFLFVSVISNLIPGRKYGRYIRLFSGMVLILLVLKPLTGSLDLEEQIARSYESFVFRYQTDDLKEELLGVEDQQLERLIGQYEEAVEMDVSRMAEEAGFAVESCKVKIVDREEEADFGTVERIALELSGSGGEAPSAAGEPSEPGTAFEVRALRSKIAAYYDLEEDYVEIQVVSVTQVDEGQR